MRKAEETQRISHFINTRFYSLPPALLQDATERYAFEHLLKRTEVMRGRTHTHTHTDPPLGTSALVKATCKALRCSVTSSRDRR